MEKINNKVQLYIKLPLFLIILILFVFIFNDNKSINLLDFVYQVPKAITVYAIGVFIFTKYLWKWNFLNGWLVNMPNLQGTWSGYLKSDWIDPKTNKGIDDIPILLVIKQDFTKIKCSIMTKESSSHTLSADIDYINDKLQLSYTYNNIPRNSIRIKSEIHNGASLLHIIEKPKRKLIGGYWTDRGTKGEIKVEFLDKILREEFDENAKSKIL